MKTESIQFLDKNVQYKVYGQGKAVMLIHGFGEDSNIWASQIQFLAPHFQMIVPDIPGSGESEWLPNASIETYAEVIKKIIDREAIKEITMIDLPKNKAFFE